VGHLVGDVRKKISGRLFDVKGQLQELIAHKMKLRKGLNLTVEVMLMCPTRTAGVVDVIYVNIVI
jgi:hypothetical protein